MIVEGNYEHYEEIFNEPGNDGKPTIVRSGVSVKESNQRRDGEGNSPVDSGSAGRDTGSGQQENRVNSGRFLGNTYSVSDSDFVYPWDREKITQFEWNKLHQDEYDLVGTEFTYIRPRGEPLPAKVIDKARVGDTDLYTIEYGGTSPAVEKSTRDGLPVMDLIKRGLPIPVPESKLSNPEKEYDSPQAKAKASKPVKSKSSTQVVDHLSFINAIEKEMNAKLPSSKHGRIVHNLHELSDISKISTITVLPGISAILDRVHNQYGNRSALIEALTQNGLGEIKVRFGPDVEKTTKLSNQSLSLNVPKDNGLQGISNEVNDVLSDIAEWHKKSLAFAENWVKENVQPDKPKMTDTQVRNTVIDKLVDDPTLTQQALANDLSHFLQSPDINRVLTDVLIDLMDEHPFAEKTLTSLASNSKALIDEYGNEVFNKVNSAKKTEQAPPSTPDPYAGYSEKEKAIFERLEELRNRPGGLKPKGGKKLAAVTLGPEDFEQLALEVASFIIRTKKSLVDALKAVASAFDVSDADMRDIEDVVKEDFGDILELDKKDALLPNGTQESGGIQEGLRSGTDEGGRTQGGDGRGDANSRGSGRDGGQNDVEGRESSGGEGVRGSNSTSSGGNTTTRNGDGSGGTNGSNDQSGRGGTNFCLHRVHGVAEKSVSDGSSYLLFSIQSTL